MLVLKRTMLEALAQKDHELTRICFLLRKEQEKNETLQHKLRAMIGDAINSFNFGPENLKVGMEVEMVDAQKRYLVESDGQYALLYISRNDENKPKLHTTQMGWVNSFEKVADYMKSKFYRIKSENGSKIHHGD